MPLSRHVQNQFENLPTAITDTYAPVVILNPVVALVARMPRRTRYGADWP